MHQRPELPNVLRFRGTERKVEDHTDRPSRLDGDIRIGALITGFPAGWLPLGFDCLF